jgi:hypothetical protein
MRGTVLLVSLLCASCATSAEPLPTPVSSPTPLQRLMAEYEPKARTLPAKDADDDVQFPVWYRAFLRAKLPGLPVGGKPQYPHEATGVLTWLEANPGFAPEELEKRVEALRSAVPGVVGENRRWAAYPREWERPIPAGTKLASLSRELEKEFWRLPPNDLQDRTPLPVWFRVYLRKETPGLSTSGPYQYPRTAARILQRLLDNPNSVSKP